MSEDTPAIRQVAASGVSFRVVRSERASLLSPAAGRSIGRCSRPISVSRVSLPDQQKAKEATGYERGAITPFASTMAWPVVADATLTGPEPVAIGAGAHAVNVHLDPTDLVQILGADIADVTRAAD